MLFMLLSSCADDLVLTLANHQAFFAEPVPTQHHVNRSAEGTDYTYDDLLLRTSGEGDIKSPKNVSGTPISVNTNLLGHVCKRVVRFSLGSMLVEGNGVVKGVA